MTTETAHPVRDGGPNMMQVAGSLMGEAIGKKMDFDIFWLLHHSYSNSCIRCGKEYKRRGWLVVHYQKTGHWRQG